MHTNHTYTGAHEHTHSFLRSPVWKAKGDARLINFAAVGRFKSRPNGRRLVKTHYVSGMRKSL